MAHIPGKDNAADVLSRLPVGSTQDDDTRETEDFAYSVASAAVPAALLPKHVETATTNDLTLRLVRKAVTLGDWTQLSGTTYKAVKEELWVVKTGSDERSSCCDASEPLEANHHVGTRRLSGHGPY